MKGTKRSANAGKPLPSAKRPAPDDRDDSEEACAERLRLLEEEVAVAKRRLDTARRVSVDRCRQLREGRAAATLQDILNTQFTFQLQLPRAFFVANMKLDWARIQGGSSASAMNEWLDMKPISCRITYGDQMLICELVMTGGSSHHLRMTLTRSDGNIICSSVSPLADYVVRGYTLWRPRVVDADASAAPGSFGALLYSVPAVSSYIARLMFVLPTVAHLTPGKDEVCAALPRFPEGHREIIVPVHILVRCKSAREIYAGYDAFKSHVRMCTKCSVYTIHVFGYMQAYLTCHTGTGEEDATVFCGRLVMAEGAVNKNAIIGDVAFATGWFQSIDKGSFPTVERLECTDRVWAPFAEHMHGAVCRSGAEFYASLPAAEQWH
jgi:hypothetical protein